MELKRGEKLVLPDWLRGALMDPFGEIMQEAEVISRLKATKLSVISVGDEVTKTLLKYNVEPTLAIFDLKSHRKKLEDSELTEHYKSMQIVRNPPKEITYDLWETVRKTINSGDHSAIKVDGEEDLAALPAIHFAALGSVLLFGVSDRGISFVIITNTIKAKAEGLLKSMELRQV
jgi:uncharacterized protein (UPF0218 family)